MSHPTILGKAAVGAPTQARHPWRAVARTIFAVVVGLAAMAPLVYEEAAQQDAAAATGWAGTALAIAGAITRVLALPAVNAFLARFVPFLAAEPPGSSSSSHEADGYSV